MNKLQTFCYYMMDVLKRFLRESRGEFVNTPKNEKADSC